MPFKALQIIEPILRSLQEEGYTLPTPIQSEAIPIVLEGKDLLGIAQTGTGKTAAFAIPIIQLLSANKPIRKRKPIRGLVLTPTRELAIQIDESFKAYGRHAGLTSVVIFGGVKQGSQTTALRRGVDILIATPGRLLDLMDQGFVDLSEIEIFVLDEADRMLDMGFVRDVHRILEELPAKRQSLFFSATMPPAIVKLAHEILDHPKRVEVTPPSRTVDRIDQIIYFVEKSQKIQLLLHLLEENDIETALVFTRTKHGADLVVKQLTREGISSEAIHGNKAQNARQRALTSFKQGKTRVLVATDIAARGIDIDELEYVINYEIPNVPETYVHRIGRTGRAGASGHAVSFCSSDEKGFLKDIEKTIGKKIPVEFEHPFAKSKSSGPDHELVKRSGRSNQARKTQGRANSGDRSREESSDSNRSRPSRSHQPTRDDDRPREPRGHRNNEPRETEDRNSTRRNSEGRSTDRRDEARGGKAPRGESRKVESRGSGSPKPHREKTDRSSSQNSGSRDDAGLKLRSDSTRGRQQESGDSERNSDRRQPGSGRNGADRQERGKSTGDRREDTRPERARPTRNSESKAPTAARRTTSPAKASSSGAARTKERWPRGGKGRARPKS